MIFGKTETHKILDRGQSIITIRFFASFTTFHHALVAQLVERILGKDEVGGSNPLGGSIFQELFQYNLQP